MAPMPLPPFRGTLKVIPYKHEGKDVFIVLDHQEQLFEHQVVLPPLAFVVATMLDGHRESADVQKEIKEQLKVDVSTDEIGSKMWQFLHALPEPGFNDEILALDIAEITKSLPKCFEGRRATRRRGEALSPPHWRTTTSRTQAPR